MHADTTRRCTTCGKELGRSLPYELWLFHTCWSCFAEPAPDRWGAGAAGSLGGTCRKWLYVPRWHMNAPVQEVA